MGSTYPTCGGTCAPGLACQGIRVDVGGATALAFCTCVDEGRSCFLSPTSCEAPGVCPPGLVCTTFVNQGVCGCADLDGNPAG
jgi:hypothetical protein